MMYKVLLGSVRTEAKSFFVGEQVELSDAEGKALIREGVVELISEAEEQTHHPEAKEPSKRTTQPQKESPVKAKKEVEPKILSEPSLDWTLGELVSYAEEREIEVPLDGSKEQILEAIKGGDKK